jgi:hypothetical protein
MGECKSSLFRDRKTFPAWGNVKKTQQVAGKCLCIESGLSILGSAILHGKLKQDSLCNSLSDLMTMKDFMASAITKSHKQ